MATRGKRRTQLGDVAPKATGPTALGCRTASPCALGARLRDFEACNECVSLGSSIKS